MHKCLGVDITAKDCVNTPIETCDRTREVRYFSNDTRDYEEHSSSNNDLQNITKCFQIKIKNSIEANIYVENKHKII